MRRTEKCINKHNPVLLVLVFALFIAISSGAGALPPSEIISCNGCKLLQTSTDEFTTWVVVGSSITLIGPEGYDLYVWKGGEETYSGKSFTVKIASNVVYTLTLNNNKVKTVRIELSSSGKSCEFVMSKINIDTTDLAVGQKVLVNVDFDENKCPNAKRSWTVDGGSSSGLFFENPQDEKTWLVVRNRVANGKNPVIRFRAELSGYYHEESLTLVIRDNSKPMIKSISTTPSTPLSYHEVVLNCFECFSGSESNDEGDYLVEFAVRVKSSDGKFNQDFRRTFDRNSKKNPSVSIGNSLGSDIYLIEARIKDSRGVYSEVFFDKIFIGFGNTYWDRPYIKLREPVVCDRRECVFDTQETENNGLGLYRRFSYRTVAGFEMLRDRNGNECVAPVCNAVLPGKGTYEIKISMQYMRKGMPDGESSEKKVTINVAGDPTAVQTAIPVSIRQTNSVSPSSVVGRPETTVHALPVATISQGVVSDGGCTGSRCKESPGIGFFASIFALVIIAQMRRK